jgi:hypothetical protein
LTLIVDPHDASDGEMRTVTAFTIRVCVASGAKGVGVPFAPGRTDPLGRCDSRVTSSRTISVVSANCGTDDCSADTLSDSPCDSLTCPDAARGTSQLGFALKPARTR